MMWKRGKETKIQKQGGRRGSHICRRVDKGRKRRSESIEGEPRMGEQGVGKRVQTRRSEVNNGHRYGGNQESNRAVNQGVGEGEKEYYYNKVRQATDNVGVHGKREDTGRNDGKRSEVVVR